MISISFQEIRYKFNTKSVSLFTYTFLLGSSFSINLYDCDEDP